MNIYTFKRINRGFNYLFTKKLSKGEIIYIKMPDVSFSKMQISDIGFQADDGVDLWGTICENVENAIWQKISDGDDVNKTINIFKAESSIDNANIILRVIMC